MGENISDTGYIWMAVNSLEKELEELRSKLKEYEGEDKRWHSFETVQAIVKERDALQKNLVIALEELKKIASPTYQGKHPMEIAQEALKKIDEIK